GATGPKWGLENELRHDLHRPRIAREVVGPLSELRRRRNQENVRIDLRSQPDGIHVSRGGLRMVKGVSRIDWDFEVSGFAEVELPGDRKIEVVDAGHLKGVASRGGEGPLLRANVAGVGVVCKVGYRSAGRILQRRDIAADICLSGRIDDCAIHGVAVE